MPRKRPRPLLKPSGYDVVIRNRNAILRINAKFRRAPEKEHQALIDEKDRLMREMWKACPHDSVADGATMTRPGPGAAPIPNPFRFCTSCGYDERPSNLKVLVRRKGRTIARLDTAAFTAKLGQVLRFTGINT